MKKVLVFISITIFSIICYFLLGLIALSNICEYENVATLEIDNSYSRIVHENRFCGATASDSEVIYSKKFRQKDNIFVASKDQYPRTKLCWLEDNVLRIEHSGRLKKVELMRKQIDDIKVEYCFKKGCCEEFLD